MSRRFTGSVTPQNLQSSSWNALITLPWSMCGWVYIVSGPNPTDIDVFYSQFGGSAIRIGVIYNTAPVLLWRAEGNFYQEFVSTGVWVHMGMTYDGSGTVKSYRDGALVDTVSLAMSSTVHNYMDVGTFDGSSVSEVAQVKYWYNYELTAGEMLLEKGYKTVVAGRNFSYSHWQLENAAPTVDSGPFGMTLAGTSGTGLLAEPDQPTGVTRLNTGAVFTPAGTVVKPAAVALSTAAFFTAGGVSSGMLNAAMGLRTGSHNTLAGTAIKAGAASLTSGLTVTPTGTTIKPGAMAMASGSVLLPNTITGITLNAAVVLATGVAVQGTGRIPVFGATTLATGVALTAAAAKRLNANVALSTGTRLAAVVNMIVGGAAAVSSGSQISATSTISATAPIWFSDEPRTQFTVHTPWISQSKAQET